ncbi:hypothetical protein SODALDRAFT_319365 [Sodiomyces alkalinus F11]|uniref:DDT domain-containing protein n=1 Tax=Sodiomyces alkalinus (strain CBS 110278 / VKM F-3762 / F11) TaxID=1314773 RepID=A0A3N2Q7K5_SODAK|nr:hypothetical protein SODALDRAFT_319365 [Sodiomyces alkalinus F11]ROT42759.1 hypothetical protein SODALDRAFT_319365 [Sodiomyces alkalinus F11]
MVLFKRKPVRFLPPAEVKDDNAEVWHIPQTGEIFTRYEDYLARMDFYRQRRFNCQITGHSGLTFFEALKSERAGAQEVEEAFPEVLKGPVLRNVQFQTVSRIDTLVDNIFEAFRTDFYPGETVTVKLPNGERQQGVVREKTRFPHKLLPDGSVRPPTTKYYVSIDGRDDAETVVDDSNLFRDRKTWTKAVLRSFVKQTVTREAWNGAPWLVKHDYATMYHIDTRIPPHLRYDTKLQERKQLQAQRRASQPQQPQSQQSRPKEATANGISGTFQPGPARLPELKPSSNKGHKSQLQHHPPHQQPPHFPHDMKHPRALLNGPEQGIFHTQISGNPFQLPSFRNSDPPLHPVTVPEPPPPPPPPPKYPIEDLELEPRPDKIRPPLAFMCNDVPSGPNTSRSDNDLKEPNDVVRHISMRSIGPLLETWDTLNVYCEIFKLDSFTFDDYVEALHVASEETPVQLFEEIHCAVLKILVSSEAEGGKVNVPLPELDEDDDEDEEDAAEEEARSPTPDEDKPPARATRSSLAKAEAERLAAEARAAELEAAAAQVKHRAEDLLEDFEWVEHLRKRNFKDGGWQRIMVGLLHQLSKDERLQERCEELLARLVPPGEEPTQETVLQNYASLGLDYRVEALQIICILTTRARAIRAYMEDCSEQMTSYRKEKIEWQRQKKQAIEELRALNDQRKILLPENMPPSPPPEPSKPDDESKSADVGSPATRDGEVSESGEDGSSKRQGRRLNDRAAERQRKRKEEQERKEKAAAEAAKVPKQSKQFTKLLKDIQKKEDLIKNCEEQIGIIDNDLREADCPRTRVLGKDRFWNRYYWFERNGMPYGGLPDSSTASAGYANGCIWVQGPDDLEREGYIDLAPEYQNEYKAKFAMTVPERKEMEEGPTSVYTARQWGYYSEPEQVDNLIRWLDPRGLNESKLRKELLNFRDKIAKNMENRKKYITPAETNNDNNDNNNGEEPKESKRGVASRTRLRQTPEPTTHYRCLVWENTTAVEELGHLHSEPPPPPRTRKPTKKRQAAESAPEPAPAPKTRRRK